MEELVKQTRAHEFVDLMHPRQEKGEELYEVGDTWNFFWPCHLSHEHVPYMFLWYLSLSVHSHVDCH